MMKSMLALLYGVEAARFKRATTKTIAGVTVHNYEEGTQEWMVMFKPGTSEATMKKVCAGKCALVGHRVPFAKVFGTESTLASLLTGNADVASMVEPDAMYYAIPELMAAPARSMASWGLDEIGADGRTTTGAGVHVYVQDTGIRVSHRDFGGRAIAAYDMTTDEDPVDCTTTDKPCAGDAQGHGSHCAGTAAGTTYGVAPGASIYAVKTLSDQGSGAMSWQTTGIDLVATYGSRPAVLSMSLGGPGTDSAFVTAIDTAVESGVTVVVASGNSAADACSFSPAFVPSAITVGATDSTNSRASYSNWGACMDIMAPGSDIVSVNSNGDNGNVALSGTSMACPHVSGAAALLLESNPDLTPPAVLEAMKASAISHKIDGLIPNDPNYFLWVSAEEAEKYDPTPYPPMPSCPGYCAPQYCRYQQCSFCGYCR